MLIPDPRGLFIQAFVGVAFFNDNYFYPWFIFCLIHYTIIWETSAANQLPPLMMWEFLVRMAIIFIWGSLAGLGVAVAMRTRALIPSHTFQDGRPRLGIFFATFGLIEGVRAVMTLTGARRKHEAFGPDPSLAGTQVLWTILLILYVTLFVAAIVLTFINYRKKTFWSWVAITYRDDYLSPLVVDYIVTLLLVLGPQALWDFLVLDPINMSQLAAGIITIVIEAVAWGAIYLWFTRYRRIDDTHFSRKHSKVWFGEFVLIVGGLQVVSGIVYVIAAEFLNTMREAEQVLGGYMTAVLLLSFVLFFVLNKRYLTERRASRKHRLTENRDWMSGR